MEDYCKANKKSASATAAGHGNDDKDSSSNSSSSIITPLEKAVALAHEMTILELAEQNEVELAYTTLRMCSELLCR